MLVQASQYYKFVATTLLAMGLLFQAPVAIFAVVRAGIVTPRQLAQEPPLRVARGGAVAERAPRGRCHAAARDPAAVPAVELSVLIASVADRRERRRAARLADNDSHTGPSA